MEIRKIKTTSEFDKLTEDWRTLQVYTFGPLIDLDYADENDDITVLVGMVNGEAVSYLIAQGYEGWHIETKTGHGGNGYARMLNEAAGVTMACEVCSDDGIALCESLGLEYEGAY